MRQLFVASQDELGAGQPAICSWNGKATHLAISGTKRKVTIMDRTGRLVDEVHLPEPEVSYKGEGTLPACQGLEWDCKGGVLAIMLRGSNTVLMWATSTREVTKVDTQMKDLSVMCWSKTGQTLAVGTDKGNLLLYNMSLSKKIPLMGKHSKRICLGQWNHAGQLALASVDKVMTISTAEGDTLREVVFKGEPQELYFAERKDDGTENRLGAVKPKETSISVNVGRNSIMLFTGDKDAAPLELIFEKEYGKIIGHDWFGDGLLCIVFQKGWIVLLSTGTQEISKEVARKQITTSSGQPVDVSGFAVSKQAKRCVVLTGTTTRMFDIGGTKVIELLNEGHDFQQPVTQVEFTPDGQVLTVCGSSGDVISFLSNLPVVNDVHRQKVAFLTSLQEMTVVDVLTGTAAKVEIETEPAHVGLGAVHIGVAMNNQAWFYRMDSGENGVTTTARVNQRDYLGTVDGLKLNDRCVAVLSKGRVQLHVLEAADDPHEEHDVMLPEQGQPNNVSCMALTESFVIYGTDKGGVHYYHLDSSMPVNEFRHDEGGIVAVYPNSQGTRLVFVDSNSNAFLYSPVNDQVIGLPRTQSQLQCAMWDQTDPNTFVLMDSENLYLFVYSAISVAGAQLEPAGSQQRPRELTPIHFYRGNVSCQSPEGSLQSFTLQMFSTLVDQKGNKRPLTLGEPGRQQFVQYLRLLRLKDAWECAASLADNACYEELAQTAMQFLEIELAVRCYRYLGNAGMVLTLEKVMALEDKNLVAGHVMLLMPQPDYARAQELFLKSARPLAALEMRKDLKHWDHALQLAKQLDASQLGDISREYASLLEVRGAYEAALQAFERATAYSDGDDASRAACQAGVARMTLHLGDIRRGRQLAIECGSQPLFRDCAAILEGMNQLQDAADMYERAGWFEKAAGIYIKSKSFALAQPLMAKINTPKLHIQYARAKELEHKYEEAAASYEMAKDLDNVVRLALDKLGNPQRAFAMVRRTRSAEGAAMVAKHCRSSGDHAAAIEFLLMARKSEEAFNLAEEYSEMDTYLRVLGDNGSPEEYSKLARYFESKGEFEKAGDLHAKCGQNPQALKFYLKCGAGALDKAIDVVGKAQSDVLTNQLVDFIMGETDGIQKDHNYMFRLHMALHDYERAAHTAVLIAIQEQKMGNYKIAHQQLFDTHKELQTQNMRTPKELLDLLMLLHSYIIVKVLVKMNDHLGAARMLVRVAKSISKFPVHVVPILTSCVIECQRAGLKATAFEYASMLVRPEYRSQIAESYKTKIDRIVRRPEKEELEEELTPCPFCNTPGPECDLQCHNCKNLIPYCIATGKRMIVSDWAECPSCRFPCNGEHFFNTLRANDNQCPMCNQAVQMKAVIRVDDPVVKLRTKEAAAAGTSEATAAPEGAAV